jgi:ACR3 family arsenite efflux pump ArsB
MMMMARAEKVGLRMSLGHVISLLVAVTLIEMSFVTGLGIRLADVVGAMRDGRQLLRAGLVNYVAVPAAAVLLMSGGGRDEPARRNENETNRT